MPYKKIICAIWEAAIYKKENNLITLLPAIYQKENNPITLLPTYNSTPPRPPYNSMQPHEKMALTEQLWVSLYPLAELS